MVQLINASDSYVLEVFARLNSYSVKVTPAELRHAEYSEPVKWAVYDTARAWSELWPEYKILSTRETVRLKNNSLIAEMFMALEQGLERGGEPAISKYYNKSKQNSDTEFHFETLRENFDKILSKIIEELGDEFKDTTFFHAPNSLLLFCAVGFLSGILPSSNATEEFSKLRGAGVNWPNAKYRLGHLAESFNDHSSKKNEFNDFVNATKSTTHGLTSRKLRFGILTKLLV